MHPAEATNLVIDDRPYEPYPDMAESQLLEFCEGTGSLVGQIGSGLSVSVKNLPLTFSPGPEIVPFFVGSTFVCEEGV